MQSKAPSRFETEVETADAEVKGLKACVRDLISVLAVPAISSGGDPPQVMTALLDVLVGMLRLDLANAVFKDCTNGKLIVLVRPQSRQRTSVRGKLGQGTAHWLPDRTQTAPFTVQSSSRQRGLSTARLRLGLHDEIGWLLVGSRRADFPTQTERLLLGVAANQAAISLQEARLLSEQKRVAQELDRKVAQRTRELHTANLELERAVREIHDLKESLQRENSSLRVELAIPRGGLAPWQVRRSKQLMTANLDRQIPLSRLAEECGLSIRHFARAFRQSAGVPPHRWLLTHRVERAKELLRDPALSLAGIALACGFADQSHFTRMFTTVVRLSPGLWRRLQLWQVPSVVEQKDDAGTPVT